jgi:predicted alpha/beta hydrolase family esterase
MGASFGGEINFSLSRKGAIPVSVIQSNRANAASGKPGPSLRLVFSEFEKLAWESCKIEKRLLVIGWDPMHEKNSGPRLIFLHGLLGSGQGFKATLLRGIFPDIVTPDMRGSLSDRMDQLGSLLLNTQGWTIIGSSMGGLMATLFAGNHPDQVDKLILLAPALTWPDFSQHTHLKISVPTTLYHGKNDQIIPISRVRKIAEQVFSNLIFHAVDDDHRLKNTVPAIDWCRLINPDETPASPPQQLHS